jgi:hypothetical protein
MCTDRFTIHERYKNILDDIDPEDIVFSFEEKPDNDNTGSIIYISDIKDLDDLENDPEDGSELINGTKELSLPVSDLTRTQQEVGASHTYHSLRSHDRRPGQYKE